MTTIVDKVSYVKSAEELTERFRELGLRVTPQRQALFRLLHGDEDGNGRATAGVGCITRIDSDCPQLGRRRALAARRASWIRGPSPRASRHKGAAWHDAYTGITLLGSHLLWDGERKRIRRFE